MGDLYLVEFGVGEMRMVEENESEFSSFLNFR